MERIRVLRSEATLASEAGTALFGSRTLAWALAHLTLHPNIEMSIADLARRLGTDYESTHRAVARLVVAGVLQRRRMGREVAVSLPRARPELQPLRAVCLEAVSLGPALQRARRALGEAAIADAFVFGSIAAGTDTEESDLDVMVLGEASLVDVAPFLRGLRDVLARDLQPLCRSLRGMRERLVEGSGFYRSVVTGPRIPLLAADVEALREWASVA
jgi:predicted nucleotidyltransferase